MGKNSKLKDLTPQELTALVPLVIIVIWLGVYPKPVLTPIDNSVKHMIVQMGNKAVTEEAKTLLVKANSIKEAE